MAFLVLAAVVVAVMAVVVFPEVENECQHDLIYRMARPARSTLRRERGDVELIIQHPTIDSASSAAVTMSWMLYQKISRSMKKRLD